MLVGCETTRAARGRSRHASGATWSAVLDRVLPDFERAIFDRHEGEFGALDREEAAEIHALASAGLGALADTMSPQGFNLGWNLGRIAGAGVVDHVHMHVVPRWAGDTNFMPVLADVKVLPEALEETRRKIAAAWP